MQPEEIDDLVSQRLRVLRVICGALVGSVGSYVAIAWFLVQQRAVSAIAVPRFLFWALGGVAALLLLTAPALAGVLRSRSSAASTDGVEQRLNGFQAAVIVAFALREGAAVIGLVLTMLSGELVWAVVLAAAAAAAMLMAWPTREALNTAARGGATEFG